MKIAAFTSCLVITLSATTAQAGICWVDKVYVRDKGIAVRFISGAPRRISTTAGTFYQADNGYQATASNLLPSGPIMDAIPMAIGDKASLSNSPEDSCSVEAVVKNGRRGLLARAFFFANLPGGKPQTAEEFTPAEDQVAPAQTQPLP